MNQPGVSPRKKNRRPDKERRVSSTGGDLGGMPIIRKKKREEKRDLRDPTGLGNTCEPSTTNEVIWPTCLGEKGPKTKSPVGSGKSQQVWVRPFGHKFVSRNEDVAFGGERGGDLGKSKGGEPSGLRLEFQHLYPQTKKRGF